MNYYNEFDPFAAAWLRELIKAGHISQGEVDERSIEDVTPNDLREYKQCHFFAGIGVWPHALRAAGWPDDQPVWTGSCPCQPFSAAGKRAGTADERHLWPAFFHLISQCQPLVVFGEQVASKDGLAWLDTVQDDLEGAGYACGAADTCAAGFGAPHIRQRLYYVAHAAREQQHGSGNTGAGRWGEFADRGELGHSQQHERRQVCEESGRGDSGSEKEGLEQRFVRGGFVSGFWGDAEWIYCRDGKCRPVEPGTFPLAHGAANRVGRLRGYGNAIVAPQAATFISAAMKLIKETR